MELVGEGGDWSLGESGVGTKVRLDVWREDQPELTVQRLLDAADAFLLRLGVLRQYLQGGDWILDVNLPGPKLVSQGASGFRN